MSVDDLTTCLVKEFDVLLEYLDDVSHTTCSHQRSGATDSLLLMALGPATLGGSLGAL